MQHNRSYKKIAIIFFTFSLVQIPHYSDALRLPLSLSLPNDPYWHEDAQEANSNINHFIEPDDTVNYTDYRYVGAHNAHVYPRFFTIVHQQDQTIIGNLSYGVRGLMLDTYNKNLSWLSSLQGPTDSRVCLSHPAPGFLAFTQKGHLTYQAMKYELRRIVEFMKLHHAAVITIILEDYANPKHTAQEIKEVMREAHYNPLFTPTDLINKQWPTLGWMRNHNKRLIIFSQRAHATDVTFHQFDYMVENIYSTTNEKLLCRTRTESPPIGQLIAFNNFSGITITVPTMMAIHQVEYTTAKRIIQKCKRCHFAAGKIFNGYWANRIVPSCDILFNNNKKTIFDYVNELNANPDKTTP
jgi:hypothetical protein